MTPRQNSSGGKERLGGVSKRGDKYIRRLLVGGAIIVDGKPLANPLPISGEIGHTPVLGNARPCGCGAVGCMETLVSLRGLLARKPVKVVALALANKTARIVWAVMKRGEAYQPKEKFVGRAV